MSPAVKALFWQARSVSCLAASWRVDCPCIAVGRDALRADGSESVVGYGVPGPLRFTRPQGSLAVVKRLLRWYTTTVDIDGNPGLVPLAHVIELGSVLGVPNSKTTVSDGNGEVLGGSFARRYARSNQRRLTALVEDHPGDPRLRGQACCGISLA